ncbi:peroxisomal membrane protein pex16 [Purpureocillium lilacinum]|uniref:Peroxisomal membrane protein PEX16 n=1 Tax=Purpureocillium lilacinum TaxID=33203 RepID=A0A179GLN6_PURLI|nr:peroxisomal membrane protein pex16 [Purpureocillium lilacinum]
MSSAVPPPPRHRPTAGQILSLPPQWLAMYDDFITKNAGQVSQIESALRSLTYIIPGRFRDAEIASESIHSGVQLLSLYHDTLLSRAVSRLPVPPVRSAHARYTRFWAHKSKLYRRVAMLLQMVVYTELLCEMSAKRRGGERARWRVVVLLEAIKAVCRLLLLRVTRSRPLVTPCLPEREPIPEDDVDDDDALAAGTDEQASSRSESELMDEVAPDSAAAREVPGGPQSHKPPHEREWTMPRTGMSLPSLPEPGDISSYLLGRVLTADDIKPAAKLLNTLQGAGQAAEVLYILAPLVYAVALARSRNKKSWTPWLVGLAVEYAARQLRDRSLRTTTLERDEWNKRGWAMGWWTMRGAFYDNVTKSVVGGVTRRMPGFIAGILEDYEYLWENYYFSTSA